MPIASRLSIPAPCAGIRLPRLAARLAAVISVLGPAVCFGQIYKWVDERGGTVYSNIRPTGEAKNVQVIAEEEKPSATTPVAAVQDAIRYVEAEAMRREQALMERIHHLERELHARQVQAQTPPPPPTIYASHAPGYYAPWGPSFTYVVFPASIVVGARGFTSRKIVHARTGPFPRGASHRPRR